MFFGDIGRTRYAVDAGARTSANCRRRDHLIPRTARKKSPWRAALQCSPGPRRSCRASRAPRRTTRDVELGARAELR